MKRIKRMAIFIAAVLMFHMPAYAINNMQSVANGAYLQCLGIFYGNENGLSLNKQLTRVEATTIALRMSGVESEAKAYQGDMPFWDVPDWANNYIAYSYNAGVIYGVSAELFASQEIITLNQFAAMLLRCIGYKDGVDFEYKNAYKLAYDIGAMKYLAYDGKMKRADAADICAGFLETKMKNSDMTLYEDLVSRGIVSASDILIANYTRENSLLQGSDVEYDNDIGSLERLMNENELNEEEEKLHTEEENQELDKPVVPEPEPDTGEE